MSMFYSALQQKLQALSPFAHLEIRLNHPLFTIKQGAVAQFVQEIEQTGKHLSRQTDSHYAEFYAQKLVQQFDLLQRAITQQKKTHTQTHRFHQTYRFPKNIHNLPPEKRLAEYRKALRLLNEKLTWLTTQAQTADKMQRISYIDQINETEYRKMKCLKAIDELESIKKG
ncbi:primosomal replication protein PriC [Bibersteinia trehalosi]|uniref:primosomal replication protein PriC n=1 Tax=Bibersteinia trehalosi TaxID=47735 RepID=UPI002D790607|nr:primosomal replication protein PriC [Bibersteinia trehalosi]